MIETKRLIIRYPKMKDLKDIYEFSKLKEVGPNAGWTEHKNIKDTKVVLKYNISQKDVYVIEYKENKKVIGLISFINISVLEKVYELGYVLHPNYWNLGIMNEVVKDFLSYIINEKQVNKIITGHTKDNIASKKIILNNGFIFDYIDYNPKYDNENIKEVHMYKLINKGEDV